MNRRSLAREALTLYGVALLCALLLGIALRCYQLDYNLDGDEIFSVEAGSGTLAHVFRVSLADVTHPPLHNLILHTWIRIFGNSEVSVRLPSVLASALFLVSLSWLAARISSKFPAFLVIALCAISPFFVYYGAQARPYALAACLAVCSASAMIRGLEGRGRSRILLYGISCAALMYTQYLGILILLPQLAYIIRFGGHLRRPLIWAGGLGILSIIPWLAMVGLDIGHQSASRISWIVRPHVMDLAHFFLSLSGYLDMDGSTRILLLLYVVALGGLFVRPHPLPSRVLLLLGSLAIFAPLSLWLISRFGPFSVWAPRQLAGSAAFFFLLVSAAISGYRTRVRAILATILVVWCLATVSTEFPAHSRPPWRSIATALEAEPPQTDVIALEGYVSEPLRYYSRRSMHDWESYASRPAKAPRLVLLCRPSHCEELNEISKQYTLAGETPIDWVKYGAKPTSRLTKYTFERNR
jgi:mannosyltransferase